MHDEMKQKNVELSDIIIRWVFQLPFADEKIANIIKTQKRPDNFIFFSDQNYLFNENLVTTQTQLATMM